MEFIKKFFSFVWEVVSGTGERKRLEADNARLYARVQELQAYSLRLEMEIKRRDEKVARDKKWNEGSNQVKTDLLKSRFRDI